MEETNTSEKEVMALSALIRLFSPLSEQSRQIIDEICDGCPEREWVEPLIYKLVGVLTQEAEAAIQSSIDQERERCAKIVMEYGAGFKPLALLVGRADQERSMTPEPMSRHEKQLETALQEALAKLTGHLVYRKEVEAERDAFQEALANWESIAKAYLGADSAAGAEAALELFDESFKRVEAEREALTRELLHETCAKETLLQDNQRLEAQRDALRKERDEMQADFDWLAEEGCFHNERFIVTHKAWQTWRPVGLRACIAKARSGVMGEYLRPSVQPAGEEQS